MRDVRERLIETLKALDYLLPDAQIADAILARWDLTEKPVVTAEELGRMVKHIHMIGMSDGVMGNLMFAQLAANGLDIVRFEDGEAK